MAEIEGGRSRPLSAFTLDVPDLKMRRSGPGTGQQAGLVELCKAQSDGSCFLTSHLLHLLRMQTAFGGHLLEPREGQSTGILSSHSCLAPRHPRPCLDRQGVPRCLKAAKNAMVVLHVLNTASILAPVGESPAPWRLLGERYPPHEITP